MLPSKNPGNIFGIGSIQCETCIISDKIGEFFQTTVFGELFGRPVWEMPYMGRGRCGNSEEIEAHAHMHCTCGDAVYLSAPLAYKSHAYVQGLK